MSLSLSRDVDLRRIAPCSSVNRVSGCGFQGERLLQVRAVFGVNDEGQKIVDVTCKIHSTSATFGLNKQTKAVVLHSFVNVLHFQHKSILLKMRHGREPGNPAAEGARPGSQPHCRPKLSGKGIVA